MGRKSKRTPCSSKHSGVLLFNPGKKAETFNFFFFTNIGPNIAKRIPKGKKSPMTYLNDKILKSFFFYSTTPDEIIKIIKSFSNNKSAGPNSLPTPTLKNEADVVSLPIPYLANLPLTTGELQNLRKIAKSYHYLKKVIPLIVLIIDLYPYSPHSVKYLKNEFTSMLTLFLRKIILFLSDSLALGQVISLIIQ